MEIGEAVNQHIDMRIQIGGGIKLAYAAKEHRGSVVDRLEKLRPDQIYIATEGPLGYAAKTYCVRKHLDFTTGYHTKYP